MNPAVLFVVLGLGLSAANSPCNRLQASQLWGDENPNVYNFCDHTTNTTAQQSCPRNYGFIRNGTFSGCIPFTQWPTNCVHQTAVAPLCFGNNLNQPSPSSNPNYFYLCPGAGKKALLLQCKKGAGFLSACEGELGCINWPQWRILNGCKTY